MIVGIDPSSNPPNCLSVSSISLCWRVSPSETVAYKTTKSSNSRWLVSTQANSQGRLISNRIKAETSPIPQLAAARSLVLSQSWTVAEKPLKHDLTFPLLGLA
jgi:hypothetical protein